MASSFSAIFSEDYNTQRDQWEKNLKLELKLEDVESKIFKKNLETKIWPTLSLEASPLHLGTQTAWKKSAQTYSSYIGNIQSWIKQDLEGGVRSFFFHEPKEWYKIEKELNAFSKKEELEIIILGKNKVSSSFKVIQESDMLMAREIHDQGGHNIQELAQIVLKVVESDLNKTTLTFGLFVDSHFFKNIAKIRALKLLVTKVLELQGLNINFRIVTLNSLREWTLYERYSNMLRNSVQVASAYIGGADIIQSSGYQTLFDYETEEANLEHRERSRRMARNTSHILALESMLGIVEDAAFGSYHLESLSQKYAQEAWELMQKLLALDTNKRKEFWEQELYKIQIGRLDMVKTRKQILAGMNDFPNFKEELRLTGSLNSSCFRVARIFEEIRLKVEKLKVKPQVEILLSGEYSALSARLSFIKNYFELLGLEVIDPLHPTPIKNKKIIVLCASDADYPALAQKHEGQKAEARFVAGKVELPGYQAIFAGQNIYDVLTNLVQELEEKS